MSEAPILIDETPALNAIEVRSRARRLQKQYGQLGLVIVDYLQLMQAHAQGENRATEISEISRSLKALAKELKVPVMALSQLNRSLEQRPNKRPVMSDLRECVTGDTLVMCADGTAGSRCATLVGTTTAGAGDERRAARRQRRRSDRVWSVGRDGRCCGCTLASGRVVARDGASIGVLTANRLDAPRGRGESRGSDRVGAIRPGAVASRRRSGGTTKSSCSGIWSAMAATCRTSRCATRRLLKRTARWCGMRPLARFGATVNRHAGRGAWHQLVIVGERQPMASAAALGAGCASSAFSASARTKSGCRTSVFRSATSQIALLLRHLWATDGSIHVRKAGAGAGRRECTSARAAKALRATSRRCCCASASWREYATVIHQRVSARVDGRRLGCGSAATCSSSAWVSPAHESKRGDAGADALADDEVQSERRYLAARSVRASALEHARRRASRTRRDGRDARDELRRDLALRFCALARKRSQATRASLDDVRSLALGDGRRVLGSRRRSSCLTARRKSSI